MEVTCPEDEDPCAAGWPPLGSWDKCGFETGSVECCKELAWGARPSPCRLLCAPAGPSDLEDGGGAGGTGGVVTGRVRAGWSATSPSARLTPWLEATSPGDNPLLSSAVGSAPCSISRRTTPTSSARAATCSGVRPSLFLRLGSALPRSRFLMAGSKEDLHASCSAVLPAALAASGFAPCPSRHDTILPCPAPAAACNGVHRPLLGWSMEAPACMRYSRHSNLP
mmetsp:Transcript_28448/g.54258  ORF Transcript_28448/g.54258 Transcript_28448/m.54258 type:complete len:224 (-) Transcript_28448:606-1277(-)